MQGNSRWRRRLGKLLLALAGPIVFLGVIEGALILVGVSPPPSFYEQEGSLLRTRDDSPWGAVAFEPSSMTALAEDDVYRIFCLGASTVYGTPFGDHCSFSKWMRQRLSTLHPVRRFEVIKMGHNGKTAGDIARLLGEVIDYDPDLVVVYTAHNEFLIENLPRIRETMATSIRNMLGRFRLGRLIMDSLGTRESDQNVIQELKNPERAIAGTPYLSRRELETGLRLYEEGITSIVERCASYEVPLILCLPTSNLGDYPPRVSVFGKDLPEASKEEILRLYDQGQYALAEEDPTRARALFLEAIDGDPSPALLHYQLGQCELRLGRPDLALGPLIEARDLDNHPSRCISPQIEFLIRQTGERLYHADCDALIREASENGIPGADLFVDNCHLDIFAQGLLCDSILRTMAVNGLGAPREDWDLESGYDPEQTLLAMEVDLTPVADQAATDVIRTLLIGDMRAQERLKRADFLLDFAQRYDAPNARVHLARAIIAVIRDHEGPAKEHLVQSLSRDPSAFQLFLTLADSSPNAKELATRLRALIE